MSCTIYPLQIGGGGSGNPTFKIFQPINNANAKISLNSPEKKQHFKRKKIQLKKIFKLCLNCSQKNIIFYFFVYFIYIT